MKVICDQSALAETLGIIGSVIASRTPNPVLTCIRLTAEDGRLTLAATDGDCGLRMVMEQVQVDEPGETLVPADKLNQIVRASSDDSLSIEVSKNIATITGTTSADWKDTGLSCLEVCLPIWPKASTEAAHGTWPSPFPRTHRG